MDDTKIRFLQEELALMQDENKELRQLIQLNREVIRIQKQSSSKEKGFQTMFNQIYEENAQIYKLNETLSSQRDEARGQALIYQQMYEDALQKSLEIQHERQAQITEQQKMIEMKDKQIQNLNDQIYELKDKRKIKQQIMVRPTEEVFQVYQQIEQMRSLMIQMLVENKSLKKERRDLLALNQLYKSQVNDNLEVYPSDNDVSQNDGNKFQSSDKKEKEDDSSFVDFLPLKVSNNPKGGGFVVPKLDIGKAMKIQKKNIEKQEQIDEQEEIEVKTIKLQQQVKSNNIKSHTPSNSNSMGMFTSTNKLIVQIDTLTKNNQNLSKELLFCRQKLQDEILLTKTQEDQIDELNRQIQDLEHINEILIQSQQKLEYKWSRFHSQYLIYQDFYLQQMNDQMRITSPRLSTNEPQTSQINPVQVLRDLAYSYGKIKQKVESGEFRSGNKRRSFSK